MLLNAFGLLPSGTRVLGGTTTYRGISFEPAGCRDEPTRPILRKEQKRLKRAGTVMDEVDPEWARIVALEIGFLFQNPISSRTPILKIGPQAGEVLDEHTDLSGEEITERVMDALGEVQLPKSKRLFRAFSSELSRGMGQRAMLAAALVKAANLVVADERTGELDSATGASILAMLREIADRGTTVVFATHDPAALGSVDEAYFVESGRLHKPKRDKLNLWLTEGTAFGKNHRARGS